MKRSSSPSQPLGNLDLDADDIRLIRLLRAGPLGRGALAERTGWARNTVVARINKLMSKGMVVEADVAKSDRGRPSVRFEIASRAALIFVVVFRQDELSATICTLAGEPLAAERREIGKRFGPDDAVSVLAELLDTLSAQNNIDRTRICICVVGVQGPVSESTRTIPWSRVGVLPTDIDAVLGMRVIIENDANLMALGAHRIVGTSDNLIVAKIASGIGAGLIIDGELHRGAAGWAGEIGHVPIPAAGDKPCICGSRGCAGGVASDGALIKAVTAAGHEVHEIEDVVELARAGDLNAIFALREAGRSMGEAVLGLVVGLSPDLVLIGGRAADVGDHLVAGVREFLAQRVPAALSARVRVDSAPDHVFAEFLGAATLGFEALFPGPQRD